MSERVVYRGGLLLPVPAVVVLPLPPVPEPEPVGWFPEPEVPFNLLSDDPNRPRNLDAAPRGHYTG
jgi:hypothetical protein